MRNWWSRQLWNFSKNTYHAKKYFLKIVTWEDGGKGMSHSLTEKFAASISGSNFMIICGSSGIFSCIPFVAIDWQVLGSWISERRDSI